MENYADILGNIMQKKVTIMQKRHQIYAEISKINKIVPLAFSNI